MFIYIIALVQISVKLNQITKSKDNYIQIQNEFSTYLQKYKSEKCMIEVFIDNPNCDQISDSDKALLSYDMTSCIMMKVGKSIPYCPIEKHNSNNIYNCIKALENDSWTTYITVSQHIDNLCYYYKSFVLDKSSEFIFEKLLNSSSGILLDLKNSSLLVKDIFLMNQQMSFEMHKNLSYTMNKFEIFEKIIKNYSNSQEKIQMNINQLESKILYGFNQLSKVEGIFGSFFNFKSSNFISTKLNFFVLLITIEIFIWMFFYDKKIIYIFLDILFFLGDNCLSDNFKFHEYYIYIITAYRLFNLFIVFVYTLCKYNENIKKENQIQNILNGNYDSPRVDAIKKFLNKTPSWIKKYFFLFQNQQLQYINPYCNIGNYELLRSKNQMMIKNKCY